MLLNTRKFIDHGAKETVVLLHGLGSSGAEWNKVVYGINENYNVIVLDLAGFGKSKKPTDVEYTPLFHANNVIETLNELNINKNITLVAHSLSTLIAPYIILDPRTKNWSSRAFFCSPPYYGIKQYKLKPLEKVNPTKALTTLYNHIISSPEEILRWLPIAKSMGIIPSVFEVSEKNLHAYSSSIEHTILKQNVLPLLQQIKIPVTFLHGKMDPLVLQEEFLSLMPKLENNFTYLPVIAGHRVQGPMRKKLVELINHN